MNFSEFVFIYNKIRDFALSLFTFPVLHFGNVTFTLGMVMITLFSISLIFRLFSFFAITGVGALGSGASRHINNAIRK